MSEDLMDQAYVNADLYLATIPPAGRVACIDLYISPKLCTYNTLYIRYSRCIGIPAMEDT